MVHPHLGTYPYIHALEAWCRVGVVVLTQNAPSPFRTQRTPIFLDISYASSPPRYLSLHTCFGSSVNGVGVVVLSQSFNSPQNKGDTTKAFLELLKGPFSERKIEMKNGIRALITEEKGTISLIESDDGSMVGLSFCVISSSASV